jgi:hypothetical protein
MNSLVFLLFELGRAQAQLAEFFWAAGSESLVERCRPVLSDAEQGLGRKASYIVPNIIAHVAKQG